MCDAIVILEIWSSPFMRSKNTTMSDDLDPRMTHTMHLNWFLTVFFLWLSSNSQMSSLAIFQFFQTFSHRVEFFSTTEKALWKTVVLKWKSTHSRFQNTKNYWNRRIIRDEIFILVMESINFTWSSVNWRHIGGLRVRPPICHSDHQYVSNLRTTM